MSYWTCKNCSEKEYIFGEGAVMEAAKQYEVPFLGEVPIHKEIAKNSDEGNCIWRYLYRFFSKIFTQGVPLLFQTQILKKLQII